MYRCPVCETPLVLKGKSYQCCNNHSFDIAKKGYINLLLSHQMSSKQPGDNKMMIAARTAFLSAGFYQPLVDRLVALCRQYHVNRLLDAGCGEGYYACQLKEAAIDVVGTDISKEGILAACKRRRDIPWSIASVAHLPYMSAQFDAVLSVFCRVQEAEFARVLTPSGIVIFVGPGANHLPQLRAKLYPQVREYRREKQADYFRAGFTKLHSENLQFAINLNDSEQIHNLLKMTPHYWHCNAAQQAAVLELPQLHDGADMTISVYRCDNA